MIQCMIYIDPSEDTSSFDLVEAARQLHAGEPHEMIGVLVSAENPPLPRVFDRLIRVEHPALKRYDQASIAAIIVDLHRIHGFHSILIPATPHGRMIAPRVAMLLQTGLVADITGIRKADNATEVIRPAYSGSLMARIRFVGGGPMMMSVRPNVFHDTIRQEKDTVYETYTPDRLKDGGIRQLSVKPKQQTYDIRESSVLVSGGGGAAKSYYKIKLLASLLGGQASASRKLVDAGIAPRSVQVGQSGQTVSPELYIALGINGAIQHIEGLRQVRHIISVNINKDAPLSSLSDIVVEGDANAFLDKLISLIQQHRSELAAANSDAALSNKQH